MDKNKKDARAAEKSTTEKERNRSKAVERHHSQATTWRNSLPAPPPTMVSDGKVDDSNLTIGASNVLFNQFNEKPKIYENNRLEGASVFGDIASVSDVSKLKGIGTTSSKSTIKSEPIKCDSQLETTGRPPASKSKANGESFKLRSDKSNYSLAFRQDEGSGDHVFNFTGFDSSEINILSHRFRKLDKNSDGSITKEEFMSIQELQTNPLVSRVIEIFDTDKTGSINFREFVNGMSLFSENSKTQRVGILRFAFRIYDIDNDGFISNGELFQVLKLMVGDNITETELQQIVDKTIMYSDTNGDGKISFQEFLNATGGIGYEQKMVLMNL